MSDIKVSTQYGPGVATTRHAASSYGLPVVVVDGTAYGSAEIGAVNLAPYGPEDVGAAETHEALLAAGYEAYA
jgi:hypothetical protein